MDKQELRKNEIAKYDAKYYEEEYWKEDIPGIPGIKYNYDDPQHDKRFLFLTDLLIQNFSFDSFVDIGCGMGHMVRNMLNLDIPAMGTEVSKAALKNYLAELVEAGKITPEPIEDMSFSDNQFDLVFCSDVMEHLPTFDIDHAITELTRITNKFLILTINLDNPYKYHPSILSREEWERRFQASGQLKQMTQIQKKIQEECQKTHPEYEFFVFEKTPSNP